MLTLQEAIEQRRSIRKYLPDDVPEEMIEQMLEAARLAPSGTNTQPWRFIVVRDKEVRKQLCLLCNMQRSILEAPVAIVCFANLDRYSKAARTNKYKELVEMGIAQTLTGRLSGVEYWETTAASYAPTREEKLLHAVANTYIAVEHLLLMATALGLGTCWLGAVDRPDIQQLFGLPDSMVSVAVVTVGYRAGENPPPRPRLSLKEIVLKPQVQRLGGEAR